VDGYPVMNLNQKMYLKTVIFFYRVIEAISLKKVILISPQKIISKVNQDILQDQNIQVNQHSLLCFSLLKSLK
jgi:hypothetical protein